MKHLTILSLLIFLLSFSSCDKDDDDNGTVNLHFLSTYDGEELKLGEEYLLDDGSPITFLKSEMFISDIILIDEDGTESKLSDVELLKFEGNEIKRSFDDIDYDDVKSLRFGIGLNAEQNAMKPEDFPSDSPLREGGYYWEAWESYIFTKTEGKFDDNGDGSPNGNYVFHTGGDICYQVFEADIENFSKDGDELNITLDFDYHAQMHPNGTVRDIANNPVIHTGNEETLIELTDIIKNSIKVTNE